MAEPAVEVHELVKRYPRSTTGNAVDGLSFRVERGEAFGLLGPNGAGLWLCTVVAVAAILLFGALGIRGFLRRALD